jgi:hypothetical protein
MTVTVKGLSGWCDADGEIVFDAGSALTGVGDEAVPRSLVRNVFGQEIRVMP